MKITDVMVKVYEPERLWRAWQQVRGNAGAAGIDQMTVDEFSEQEENLLAVIHDKLLSGSYRFKPARRVEIPKEGTGKTKEAGDTSGDGSNCGRQYALCTGRAL